MFMKKAISKQNITQYEDLVIDDLMGEDLEDMG